MKFKYCLPVIKKTKKEVLISLNTKGYHFYEVWLEYINDLDNEFVVKICKLFKGRIIFVLRRQNLERIKLAPKKRIELINLISKYNVFLDIDFLTQDDEVEVIKNKSIKAKIILSFHNYRNTPSLDYLKNLVNKMERYNPNILKFATFCKHEKDTLTLLNLLLELKEKRKKYIILGMGNKGLITRIFGPIWGNEISFAPKLLSEKSAVGQLTKTQMEDIFSKILT